MKVNTILAKKSDNIGIISSVLCLIHCLALPLLITLLPMANQFIAEEIHHLDYAFWVFSLIAVYYSSRQTNRRDIRYAFYIAGLLFTAGILLEDVLPGGHTWAYMGSFCLIVTHSVNIRHCKHCAEHHHQHQAD
jgi:MerC mercury resistance protein